MSERVALVTGASRGIGAATARELAAQGLRVALAARGVEALEELRDEIVAAGGEAVAFAVDLSDGDQLASLVDRIGAELGRLDVLVNNAGVFPKPRRTHEVTIKEFTAIQQINLVAPWYLACRARDLMVRTGGGVVINVTSTAAAYPGIGIVHYSSSKAALTMLTRGLALEWASDRIRVVGVAPGRIDTEMLKPITAFDERMGRAPNPMNRLGTPGEVASLIAYLASDAAAYVTGTVMTIDGGELLAVPFH